MACLHVNVFLTQNKIAKMDLETTTIVMQFLLLDMTCKYEKLVNYVHFTLHAKPRETNSCNTFMCINETT
jgi:hypothetical protein